MREGCGNRTSLIKLIWVSYLDPSYVKSLSVGVIWNFCEGPEFPRLGNTVWVKKVCFKA